MVILKIQSFNPNVMISLDTCRQCPELSLLHGVIAPLASLHLTAPALVLVDGLCEAEQHR